MVKFGVFTDLHVDIMHDTQERLQVFLDHCRRENVDFIIHLGDFCYPDDNRKVNCIPEHQPVNIANALKVKTYADKPAILRMFNDFEKPSYHVLGNHECDMCSKEELLRFIEAKNGSYYSFDRGGFHFVVLDCSFFKDADGNFHAYENGNYFEVGFDETLSLPWLPDEQVQWLKDDLAKASFPSVIFSHQTLSNLPKGRAVKNWEVIREILKSAPKGVAVCFNGHHHVDLCTREDDIWFVQLNSMDCLWVDEDFATENRYGREIDEKYPNIKYTLPYRDPVYAIVSMDEKGITVKGTKSEFVGPDDDEIGLYTKPGSWWTKLYGSEFRASASQQDRYLPFD